MDGTAFDDLVASLDGAMVVVTASADGEADGCLVGFHSQCSIEPRRYGVWLSVANRTFELAQRATHLAVHLLGADQHDVAELFGGQTGDEVDKLARCGTEEGAGGTALLRDCPTRFVGEIVERLESSGDHHLFVLQVVEASAPARVTPLRLSAVTGVRPGHAAEERR